MSSSVARSGRPSTSAIVRPNPRSGSSSPCPNERSISSRAIRPASASRGRNMIKRGYWANLRVRRGIQIAREISRINANRRDAIPLLKNGRYSYPSRGRQLRVQHIARWADLGASSKRSGDSITVQRAGSARPEDRPRRAAPPSAASGSNPFPIRIHTNIQSFAHSLIRIAMRNTNHPPLDPTVPAPRRRQTSANSKALGRIRGTGRASRSPRRIETRPAAGPRIRPKSPCDGHTTVREGSHAQNHPPIHHVSWPHAPG